MTTTTEATTTETTQPSGKTRMTHEQWLAEGTERFGPDQMRWRFRCPVCGHEATPADYKAAGAPKGAVGFSCIGRWVDASRDAFGGEGDGPCNYAGGGLFGLNPVVVTDESGRDHDLFAFGEPYDAG